MNTVIFRTVVPGITAIMLVFSIFVLLRGHNEPGGGFIGGLIAASGVAVYGIARGVKTVRRAIMVEPLALAGFGVFIAGFAGVISLGWRVPYLTGLWAYFTFGDTEFTLSTPLVFDIGVYCAVAGTLSAIALALEENDEAE